jgi:hypothetical protein
MVRRGALALRLDFGEMPFDGAQGGRTVGARRGLVLARLPGITRGPEKYRLLDLKRRRAQIRARRALGVVD